LAEADARPAALRAAIREALGPRPQRWLAHKSGLGADRVSRILLGKQAIQLEDLQPIADALGVSPRSLLTKAGYVDDAGLLDPDVLPEGGRRAVLAIFQAFGHRVESDGVQGVEDVR
jgi:transcriptional regulator with XRE-family HTH domain